jgi:kumamolisin
MRNDGSVILVFRPPEQLQEQLDALGKGPLAPLSHAEYLERYGTPDEDLERLEAWAASAQLQLADAGWREKAKLSGAVQLTGTPPSIDDAFGVERDGATGALQLRVPEALDGLLLWVFGVHPPTASEGSSLPEPPRPSLPALGWNRPVVSSPDKSLSPLQLAEEYQYPANRGAGQCLGLIELTGAYSSDDVRTYLRVLGVTPEPRIVDVALGPRCAPSLANLEVTMDLELAASLCPEATIVVYNACSRDYSLRDFFKVFNVAVFDTEHRPSVLSTSWGFPECVPGINSGIAPRYAITEEEEAPFNLLFAKAALLGITICASSGDTGSLVAFPCASAPSLATLLPLTYFPAASPFVLGCGGTQMPEGQDQLKTEVVWNQLGEALIIDGGAFGFPVAGGSSGGGVSFLNGPPSYQEDCPVPEARIATWTHGVYKLRKRHPGRGVPDVAAYASLNPGYAIFYRGEVATAGGTSAAAPMWAALIIRINAELGQRVGFLHPSLYKHQLERKTLFKTIQHGGNGAYHASEAVWNACTGLGTPNGLEIVKALQQG